MKIRSLVYAAALSAPLSSCAVQSEDSGAWIEPGATGESRESIVNGTLAGDYPEAIAINMRSASGQGFACSGVMIAPRVALTAGHCIDGMSSWEILIDGQSRPVSGAETYDWHESDTTNVNPNHHDVGLVYLKDPVALGSYPALSGGLLADGTRVTNVGRILNDALTNRLYKATVSAKKAASIGFPFDYYSSVVIQHGDSGGPVFQDGTHTVVAINSGANDALQVLARVDLLTSWILARAASTGASVRVDTRAGAAPACANEVEPNDTLGSAKTLVDNACGSLKSGSDLDYYSAAAPIGTTTLELVPSGDASFDVGFLSGARCSIQLRKQRAVTVTVAGASRTLCLAVSSPSKSVQSYRLDKVRK